MSDWSDTSVNKINNIKKSILRKRIMLTIIIDSYSTKDKFYRYLHIILAVVTPILAIIDDSLRCKETASSETPSIITIILSTVVAGMVKLKDYLDFDKIRDVSKTQSVKYGQLYDRIESEMVKPANKKQSEDDFIYWIVREYNNIELDDPDLKQSDKEKFIAVCKEKGIPFDEDFYKLQDLTNIPSSLTTKNTPNINTHDPYINQNTLSGNSSAQSDNPSHLAVLSNNKTNLVEQTNQIDQTNISSDNPQSTTIENEKNNREINVLVKEFKDELNDENCALGNLQCDKQKYKDTLKNMDTKADLRWALERLNNLD